MSGIIRAPRPARGWTEVQNSVLRDARISYRARGVLVRLLSNADGYRMSAADISKESPAEGRDAILTALKELRDAGYIVQRRMQDARGRWCTETVVYDTPQIEVGSTEVGSAGFGSPEFGSPNRVEKYQEKNQKNKYKNKETTPKREQGAVPPASAAKPRSHSGGVSSSRSSYKTDPTTGISLQVGNQADADALNEIRQHHPDAIAQAVARAAAGEPGGRAYPSAVLRLLRRAARAAGAGSAGAGADAPAWARRQAPLAPAPREIDITEGETL